MQNIRMFVREELARVEWKTGDPASQFILRLTYADEINLLEELLEPCWGEAISSRAYVGGTRAFSRILGFAVEWGADRSELVRFEVASRETLIAIARSVTRRDVPALSLP